MADPALGATGDLGGVRRALVVGLGRAGHAAASALVAAGVDVVATDRSPDVDAVAGADVRTGMDDAGVAAMVADVDLVVPSPGVRPSHPALRAAAAAGVPVWSEPELGWRLAAPTVLGITGTNGKTTVTELAAAMLRESGRSAVACGNIGHPFTTAALEATPSTILVAELSSFQLRFVHLLRPRVGVLLNVAPDHLDWHGDEDAYRGAKARIWRAQRDDDWAVVNLDDPVASGLLDDRVRARRAGTSTRTVPETGVGVDGDQLVTRLPGASGRLLAVSDLPGVPARHRLANVAAAACAALLGGGVPEGVAAAAIRMRPGPHRMQVVARAGGMTWVDDSKATNPHAAAASLDASSAHGPVVWIAGGLAKGVDLRLLADHLDDVVHAVVIGEAAAELSDIAADAGIPVTRCASIEAAVATAARVAPPGATVLLAPACASFDQFRDYVERGERFVAAVRQHVDRGRGA